MRGGGEGGGVGTGIQDPKFMEGIMSGSLRSHEIIYQKRFVSKIYLCTCSNIKLFVSWDNAESPYKSILSEGG